MMGQNACPGGQFPARSPRHPGESRAQTPVGALSYTQEGHSYPKDDIEGGPHRLSLLGILRRLASARRSNGSKAALQFLIGSFPLAHCLI